MEVTAGGFAFSAAWAYHCDSALRALNALYGATAGGLAEEFWAGGWNAYGVSHRRRPVTHLAAAQQSIVDRVVRRAARAGVMPDEVPVQGALLNMCRMKDIYDAEPALLEEFDYGRVKVLHRPPPPGTWR